MHPVSLVIHAPKSAIKYENAPRRSYFTQESLYVSIFVCKYVCIYMWMYVNMYACICGCTYACMYAYMYVCLRVCTVCPYVCITCMYVCMNASMHKCIYVRFYNALSCTGNLFMHFMTSAIPCIVQGIADVIYLVLHR